MAFSTIVSCCRHQSIVITISTSTIRQLFFVLFSFDQNISCSCVNQIFVFDFSCYCCCCCLFLPKRNNLAVRLWFCFSCFSSVCRPLNCFFSSPGAFHLWLDIDCVKYKVFVRRQTGTKCEYEKVSELLFVFGRPIDFSRDMRSYWKISCRETKPKIIETKKKRKKNDQKLNNEVY